MNSSLFNTDAATHLKIVLIALAASASVVAIAVGARTGGGPVFGPGRAQPESVYQWPATPPVSQSSDATVKAV